MSTQNTNKIVKGYFMTIGERLRVWRKENKISAKVLAENTGILQQTVSNYELNKSPISADFLVELYKKYCIDIIWLITGNKSEDNLSAGEKQLLQDYRNCNQEGKAALNATAAALSKSNIDTDTVSKSNHDSPELSTSKTG